MQVWIERGTQGAARAAARGDVVVVVDALRASVTITAALAAGARQVVTVLTVEEAMAYRAQPGFVLAGERNSLPVPSFDLGNSPTELLDHADLIRHKSMVLTTSNGTRCVQAARPGARAVLTGSLPNADALIRETLRLAGERGGDVSLVAAGTRRGEPAAEDEYTVNLLAAKLGVEGGGDESSLAASAKEVFRDSPHGRRLAGLGFGADVELCARLNVFDVACVFVDGGFVAIGVKA